MGYSWLFCIIIAILHLIPNGKEFSVISEICKNMQNFTLKEIMVEIQANGLNITVY